MLKLKGALKTFYRSEYMKDHILELQTEKDMKTLNIAVIHTTKQM